MEKDNIFVNEGQTSPTTLYKTHQNHDLNSNFFNPNWENSMDQNDPFESALSSMVSSPTATSNNGGENNNMFQLRELIGRLGSISNSNNNYNHSTNTSCYSTPLNSPPKHFPPFSSDPSFAERAAKFSNFSAFNRNFHPSDGICDSLENSENNPGSRKRKAIPKGGKGKDPITPTPAIEEKKDNQVEKSGKRSKTDEKKELNDGPKDYIHVRARRGQATDAHSLAERVRREKISERMKCLQDLVPGCNKVTGKAVMLDEIINYVQSLQRQVEFLSMKLATVDPRMDLNTEALISKDIFQSRGSLPRDLLYSSDSSYQFQSLSNLQNTIPNGIENNNFNVALGRNELPPIDNFSEAGSQVSTFWEDDLHSIVQMGFGQNQTQNFHGIIPKAQMKVEL